MSINTQAVAKSAKLAKIKKEADEQFLEKYAGQLAGILDYFEELKEVDYSNVESTDIIRTVSIEDLAEDEPYPNQEEYQRTRQNIINNFPQSQSNFLVLSQRVVE